MNILLDDASPELRFFSQADGWIDDHRDGTKYPDSSRGSYSHSTFHCTQTDGDYMEFRFNGTGISIVGSKRNNHGVYGVKVDDETETFYSGYSANPIFQTELYDRNDLSTDQEHIIRITNYPTRTDPQPSSTPDSWLDIDYLLISHAISDQVYTTTLDDTSPGITYDASWTNDAKDPVNYNRTIHLTGESGGSMLLPFNGISIQIFSGLNVDHGEYSVSIDDGPAQTFNGSHFERSTQVPHFTASGLAEGPHVLKITNSGTSGSPIVGFDFAIVNSTVSPDESISGSVTSQQLKPTFVPSIDEDTPGSGSDSKSTNIGAIVGGVIAGVVALTVLAVLAWCYLSRKPRKVSSKTDNRHKSYIDFPSGSARSRTISEVESKTNGSRIVSTTATAGDNSPTSQSMFGSLRGLFKKRQISEEEDISSRSDSPQGSIAYFYTPHSKSARHPRYPSSAGLTSPSTPGQMDSFDNQIYRNPPPTRTRTRPSVTHHVSQNSITSRSSAYSQGGETYLTDRLDNLRGPVPLPSPPSQGLSDYEHMPLPPLPTTLADVSIPASNLSINNITRSPDSSERPTLSHADASSSLLPSIMIRQSLGSSLRPTNEPIMEHPQQTHTSSTNVSPSDTPQSSQVAMTSPDTPGDFKRSILGLTLERSNSNGNRSHEEDSAGTEGGGGLTDIRRLNMTTPSVLDLEPPILSPPPDYSHIMSSQQQQQ
ncbi:hypothetical protein I302_108163 [Kwoniella bestiolae CBS 10118]|uniref:Uncharacterized protein n=1 Tax=Kwoniella bestiolae CBS 10118 TaxID=1296100 RepID=A0A1B9FWH5_9TREE|nr:hypothetical protein I302_07471 [Kwoniella bestiolae CBS 10118]OCF23119.1 hypothetical protein I302_07471 [Kwoniella bestiolae CBS 10118]